jgi:hypothetical protein
VKIVRVAKNKRFDAAWVYVVMRYCHLFDGTTVTVYFEHQHPQRLCGNCTYTPTETFIRIFNKRHTAAQYVNTLVHELVHHQQYASGRAKQGVDGMSDEAMEREATAAGNIAERKYIQTLKEERGYG